jgi:hypothetical protein
LEGGGGLCAVALVARIKMKMKIETYLIGSGTHNNSKLEGGLPPSAGL